MRSSSFLGGASLSVPCFFDPRSARPNDLYHHRRAFACSALADCQMGLKYDPSLMRCALRVATCHG